MINVTEIRQSSDSRSSGGFSAVYLKGNQAFIATPKEETLTNRMKFNFYKSTGLLHSVDRETNCWQVVLTVKRLDSVFDYPSSVVEIERQKREVRHILDDLDATWSYLSLETVEEIATNPLVPLYHLPFLALYEIMKSNKGRGEFKAFLDDHFGNFMVDPDTKQIIPIDLIAFSGE